jgi:hypothetical protein
LASFSRNIAAGCKSRADPQINPPPSPQEKIFGFMKTQGCESSE